MSTSRRLLVVFGALGALAAAPAAQAQKCKEDVPWAHQHTEDKAHTMTTDVKGSRSTRIEVCRADAATATATNLKVEVQFEGSHAARALPAGECTDKFAKWAVVRTVGAKAAGGGPGEVSGLYRVCKE